MAWIESHQSLAQHPKTKRLARKLGIHRMQAIGHLHALWWWAVDYAEDGYLGRYDDEDIADAMEWDGNATELVTALIEAGFIDDGNERRIHDWDEYIGKLVSKREADRARKRSALQRNSSGSRAESDSGSEDSERNQPTNQPTNSNQPTGDRAIALDAPSAKMVTKDFLEHMKTEFPALDVEHEWERASNHKSYKKAIDKRRYFQNWLKQAVEYHKRDRPPTSRTSPESNILPWAKVVS